jgi:uncharacterized membrane protein
MHHVQPIATLAASPALSVDVLSALAGRLHPMVLHLPIGLIGALIVMDAWRWWRGDRELPSVALPLAWLNAAMGVAAAVSGILLAREPGYSGIILDRHRMLGIALGALCLLVAVALTIATQRGQHNPQRARGTLAGYRLLLVTSALLLVPVGHLGATMTHGEGFLIAPLTVAAKRSAPSPAGAATTPSSGFPRAVEAVVDRNCTACHGETRAKGLLAMHTLAALRAGGENGEVVVFGDPEASAIMRRMLLPLDDDDHMPPEGKPQPTDEEIATIQEWILLADENGVLAEPASGIVARETAPPEKVVTTPAAADPAAVAALRGKLIHVQPIANDSSLLWIDFAATSALGDDAIRPLLEPLRDFIGDLSLARTAISDQILPLIASMPALRRLDLRDTPITDAGVAALEGHAALEELVLSGTKVSDASLGTLRSIETLRAVYAWRSGLSRDALVALRAERPGLVADADDTSIVAAVETEPALAFSSDAPIPGASSAATATAGQGSAALAPINAACPVSGAAVNPTYVIVWEGRAVGFCCEKCAAQFWAEPARFVGAIKPK